MLYAAIYSFSVFRKCHVFHWLHHLTMVQFVHMIESTQPTNTSKHTYATLSLSLSLSRRVIFIYSIQLICKCVFFASSSHLIRGVFFPIPLSFMSYGPSLHLMNTKISVTIVHQPNKYCWPCVRFDSAILNHIERDSMCLSLFVYDKILRVFFYSPSGQYGRNEQTNGRYNLNQIKFAQIYLQLFNEPTWILIIIEKKLIAFDEKKMSVCVCCW